MSKSNKATVKTQELPPNEAKLLSQCLKFHEEKNYPRALTLAEQILSSCPEHGETIAMKGLLSALVSERYDTVAREAGLQLIKKGIMKNIKSPSVWNIQYLYYRNERQYVEAAKSLSQCMRLSNEPESMLRDLSTLQAQAGLRDAHLESRRKLLMLRSNIRSGWMGYAAAAHLAGNLPQALSITQAYRSSQQSQSAADADKKVSAVNSNDPKARLRAKAQAAGGPTAKNQQDAARESFEASELAMYEIQIMEELGKYQEALGMLINRESEIVDVMGFHQTKANLLERLGRKESATEEYEWMLRMNPENYNFHYGLLRTKGLSFKVGKPIEDEKTYTSLKEHFASLEEKYPKASAVKRLQLDFLNQTDFPGKAKSYVVPLLRSGVPSLFKDMRPLYSQQDGWKGKVLDNIVLECLQNLDESGRMTADDEKNSDSPAVVVWVLTYLAHSADYNSKWNQALEYVNRAIKHSPTVLDLYMLRAGIYKHAGDIFTALKDMNKAREMDLADRFVNTKCTRYAFQAGEPELADKIISLFITEQNLHTTLYDLQVSWYFTQRGLCFKQKKDFGRALKALLAVDDFFEQYFEDQLDYHLYTMRKSTMRAYTNLIRWAAQLKQHKFYVKATTAAVEVFLALYFEQQRLKAKDRSVAAQQVGLTIEQIGGETGELTAQFPTDEKKAEFEAALQTINEQRKSEESSQDAEKTKEVEANTAAFEKMRGNVKLNEKQNRGDLLTAYHTPDIDPAGAKIIRCCDSLALASKYVHALTDLPGAPATNQIIAFEYFLTKGKLVPALRALKHAMSAVKASTVEPHLESPPPNEFEVAQIPKPVETYPSYPSWFEFDASAGVQRSRELVVSVFDATVHECQMRLALRLGQVWESLAEPTKALFEEEFGLGSESSLPARSLDAISNMNQEFASKAGATSIAARVAVARVEMAIEKASSPSLPSYIQTNRDQGYSIKAVENLASITNDFDKFTDLSRSTVRQALSTLAAIEASATSLGGPECKTASEVASRASDVFQSLQKAGNERFPFDIAMLPEDRVTELKAANAINVQMALPE